MNLEDLAIQMETLSKELPERANRCGKDTAITLLNDLTQVTPADTGAAITNWQASTEAPNTEELPPHFPSPRGRMIAGKWTHTVDPEITAQANVPPTFDIGKLIIEAKAPGQDIYISNVLPYIEKLDQGSSQQAPAGFIDRAVILAQSVVDKFKLLK